MVFVVSLSYLTRFQLDAIMLNNVSYRFKIPLALMLAILLTEMAVTGVLIALSVSDARRNLESGAQNLTKVIALSVRDLIVRDDLFRVFEVIRAPVSAKEPDNPLKQVVVFDSTGRVYASTAPKFYATLSHSSKLGDSMDMAIDYLQAGSGPFYFSFPSVLSSQDIVAAQNITAGDGTRLGYVIATYDTQKLRERIEILLLRLALLNVASLLVLLPLGWWWGNRMATPLHHLSLAMTRVHKESTGTLKQQVASGGQDEIGRLSASFHEMLDELSEKQQLERDMVAAERLAAVGRVAAGIAHEINNPLGGLINAVDTLAKHGAPDGLTSRTLALLDRGLSQIRATVSALLLEARLDSPSLSPGDWEDLRLLVEPQVASKSIHLLWIVPTEAITLPSHLVRQLVLNLLLNAVKAAETGGGVRCVASAHAGELRITVSNSGEHIPEEVISHLFEPYSPSQRSHNAQSHGLGLWVTYQIVSQLCGTVTVASEPGDTIFTVVLPVKEGDAP
jgi:two-component system NtrC family sensor kinase